MNVGQMLVNTAKLVGARPAIKCGESTTTYAEFDRRTNALARGLAQLGLSKGDRVAVYMRNRPELLDAMYACFKAGYCFVPLNARLTREEVAYHVEDSGAAVLITDFAGTEAVAGINRSELDLVVCGAEPPEGWLSLELLIESADGSSSAVVPVERDDLAWLFYTSGTTGRPKGAMLTHGNLAFCVASWLADLIPMSHEDATLHVAPLTHGAGFHALATVARGGRQVITTGGRFDPSEVLGLVKSEGITNTWMVPTQIVMMTDAVGSKAVDLPSLRRVVYGAAPMPPAELKRALEIFGPVFVQLYAQGECPMTVTYMPPEVHAAAVNGDHPERLASAGFARPGMDVRLLGPHDEPLPPSEVGEVCVRGLTVMRGYWNRPEASAEALRNGWLHTGDLGRMDENGYLYLLDRAKDMIITGGSNVYAIEIEAVLAEHPAVRVAAVVGTPDRTWGEIVTAVVVADEKSTDKLEAELTVLCTRRLAGYKRPRRYIFAEELPRNAYGKILKRDIRAGLAIR